MIIKTTWKDDLIFSPLLKTFEGDMWTKIKLNTKFPSKIFPNTPSVIYDEEKRKSYTANPGHEAFQVFRKLINDNFDKLSAQQFNYLFMLENNLQFKGIVQEYSLTEFLARLKSINQLVLEEDNHQFNTVEFLINQVVYFRYFPQYTFKEDFQNEIKHQLFAIYQKKYKDMDNRTKSLLLNDFCFFQMEKELIYDLLKQATMNNLRQLKKAELSLDITNPESKHLVQELATSSINQLFSFSQISIQVYQDYSKEIQYSSNSLTPSSDVRSVHGRWHIRQ
jgi:hypothetical protein